jgi:uncharacterized membrane protein YfcA
VKEIGTGVNKMKDKSLGILLTVAFGISGIAIILLGWLLPSLQSDKITITLAGFLGIAIAIINIRSVTKSRKDEDTQHAVTVEIEDNC